MIHSSFSSVHMLLNPGVFGLQHVFPWFLEYKV